MKAVIDWLREVRVNADTVGALLPSFPAVGMTIAKQIGTANHPRTFLELGAGDGAVTAQILPVLAPGDRLELVEINPHFCERLIHRIHNEWSNALRGVEVVVHQKDLRSCNFTQKFDIVISGLPLINFAYDQVQEIYFQFSQLVQDQGQLLSFEYACSRRFKKLMGQLSGNRELVRTCLLIEDFHQRYQVGWEPVFFNVPPMKVRRFALGEACEIAYKNSNDSDGSRGEPVGSGPSRS